MSSKSSKESKTSKVDVSKHYLVPKHVKLNEKEKQELLEKYSITVKELPKILRKDPAIVHINAAVGDVIKITRDSPTAIKADFYRGVVDE